MGLCVYHTALIKNNLTTKEELKDVYQPPQGNPFKRSFFKNIQNAFFSNLPKISLLDKMKQKAVKKKNSISKKVIF